MPVIAAIAQALRKLRKPSKTARILFRRDRRAFDPVFYHIAEIFDETLDRPGRSIAERADRVTFDLFGYVKQHIDLFHRRFAFDQTVHHPHHPACTFTARRTLPAGFVFVKRRQPPNRLDDIGRLVHHDHRRCS